MGRLLKTKIPSRLFAIHCCEVPAAPSERAHPGNELLKSTPGELGHFFKLGACRLWGWEAAWPAERGDTRKRGGGSQSSRQAWQYKPATAWLSYLREPRSRGALPPSAAGAPRPSAARGALLSFWDQSK